MIAWTTNCVILFRFQSFQDVLNELCTCLTYNSQSTKQDAHCWLNSGHALKLFWCSSTVPPHIAWANGHCERDNEHWVLFKCIKRAMVAHREIGHIYGALGEGDCIGEVLWETRMRVRQDESMRERERERCHAPVAMPCITGDCVNRMFQERIC